MSLGNLDLYSTKKYGVFSEEEIVSDLSLAEYSICDKLEKDINGLIGNISNVFSTNHPYMREIEIEIDENVYNTTNDLDNKIELIKRSWKDLNLELATGTRVSSKFVSELKRIYLSNPSLQSDQDFLKLLDILEIDDLYGLKNIPKKFIVRYANSIFKSVIEKMRNLFPYSEFVIAFNIVLIEFNLEQGSVASKLNKLNDLNDFASDSCSYLTERLGILMDNFNSYRENFYVDDYGNDCGTFSRDWIYEGGVAVEEDINKVLKIAWPMINNTWTEIKIATSFRDYLLADMPYLNTQNI